LFDPIDIVAPAGTIVNPNPPAACGARSITCQKIAGAIFGAFRGLLPRQEVMASSNDVLPAIVFSGRHRRHQRTYVYLETLGGGAGARLGRDGMDGIQVHVTNTSNLPVEALENEYPLIVEAYGLVAGSGGAGRSRGGLGIARQIRALEDDTVFGCRSDSHLTRAEGVFGGLPGAPGGSSATPAGRTKRSWGQRCRVWCSRPASRYASRPPAAAAPAPRNSAAPSGAPRMSAAGRRSGVAGVRLVSLVWPPLVATLVGSA